MAESEATSPVLAALLNELAEQGQGGYPSPDGRQLTTYPIKGTIDLVALAEAVENALGADTSDDDAKTVADLNAANDG
jgi:hypothetical protein